MSYHRDEHWFDFDSDLLDALYPMTDLDHLIARHGTEEAFKKLKKPNKQVDDRKIFTESTKNLKDKYNGRHR